MSACLISRYNIADTFGTCTAQFKFDQVIIEPLHPDVMYKHKTKQQLIIGSNAAIYIVVTKLFELFPFGIETLVREKPTQRKQTAPVFRAFIHAYHFRSISRIDLAMPIQGIDVIGLKKQGSLFQPLPPSNPKAPDEFSSSPAALTKPNTCSISV